MGVFKNNLHQINSYVYFFERTILALISKHAILYTRLKLWVGSYLQVQPYLDESKTNPFPAHLLPVAVCYEWCWVMPGSAAGLLSVLRSVVCWPRHMVTWPGAHTWHPGHHRAPGTLPPARLWSPQSWHLDPAHCYTRTGGRVRMNKPLAFLEVRGEINPKKRVQ